MFDSHFSDIDLKISWSSKVSQLNEEFKQGLYSKVIYSIEL